MNIKLKDLEKLIIEKYSEDEKFKEFLKGKQRFRS